MEVPSFAPNSPMEQAPEEPLYFGVITKEHPQRWHKGSFQPRATMYLVAYLRFASDPKFIDSLRSPAAVLPTVPSGLKLWVVPYICLILRHHFRLKQIFSATVCGAQLGTNVRKL